MQSNPTENDLATEMLMHDPRWKLVERITANPSFAKSVRLSTLLLFITRESLTGHPEDLCEQLIGERVFGRSAGYNPRDDNIVRSHASRLRHRLETYFREEAVDEELRVTIPRGSYVPVFERANVPAAAEVVPAPVQVPAVHTLAPPVPAAQIPVRATASRLALGLIAITAVLLGGWWLTYHGRIAVAGEHTSPTHRLWSAMFSSKQDTLIVPADSSLVLLKSFTGYSVGLAEYASGQYLTKVKCMKTCDTELLLSLAKHRYTSIADLDFAVAINRMPEELPNRTEIRYARDLQLADLKQKNLILIGSLDADPWLELFQGKMNFLLNDDRTAGPKGIVDRKPLAGEQPVYLYDNAAPPSRGYATIAFLPNIDGTGNVLVVQGFTLADTQAAAEFITGAAEFDALLAPAADKRAVFPHFEVLLRTTTVNGTAARPSVLAFRVY